MIGAINDLFTNEVLRRSLFKARFLLAAALLFPLAYYMRTDLFWIGFAVSMVGQFVQTWSFACLLKNLELTMQGPYLLVRNPMYLGRFFLLLGFILLLGSVLAVGAYTVIYVLYMTNRVKREERRLQRVFGEQFASYCARVNRFIPSLGGLREPELWRFDLSRFRENHAHWNLLSTLLAFALLVAIRIGLHGWS